MQTPIPSERPYRGVFPVVPTIFYDDGALDLDGQRRCLDFMIDAGSDGLCILANFSEQFVLSDDERERIMVATLEHVKGRVPVIVTTSHMPRSYHRRAKFEKRRSDRGPAFKPLQRVIA